MELFDAILKAQENQGRVQGLQYAVVADTEDPLGIGRVQCYDVTKGGAITDWLIRIVPAYGISLPLPPKGATVLIGYMDGNPHQGVYFGTLTNLVNPQGSPESIIINIGNTGIEIYPGGINITGVTSVSINGKQVATIDAVDDNGDLLTSKGWA